MHGRELTIDIVDFSAEYSEVFKQLNREWMQALWPVHELHDKIVDDPQGLIINRGGAVAIALRDGDPVGTCALINCGEGRYELAKMCVSENAQGLGIGRSLASYIIATARNRGAKIVFLKTAAVLHAAIALYEKLGFQRLDCYTSADTRCDIEMEMRLQE